MTSVPRTSQQNRDTESQLGPVPFLEPYIEPPQSYNTSGLELDLRRQLPLEPAYPEPPNRALQHEAAPFQKTNTRPHALRRSTIFLVALIAAIIIIAVIGGTMGSLVRK